MQDFLKLVTIFISTKEKIMKKLHEHSLEELRALLFQIDEELGNKKTERHKLVEQKAEALDEEYIETTEEAYITKNRLLDEYKEELNETLGINILRNQRQSVRDEIDDKEKELDARVAENYR